MKNDFLDYSESLEHYGVLGMKWGVRKQRSLTKKAAKQRGKAEAYEDVANGARQFAKMSKGSAEKQYFNRSAKQFEKAAAKAVKKEDAYLAKRNRVIDKHVEKMQNSGKEYANKYIDKIKTMSMSDLARNYNRGYIDATYNTPSMLSEAMKAGQRERKLKEDASWK